MKTKMLSGALFLAFSAYGIGAHAQAEDRSNTVELGKTTLTGSSSYEAVDNAHAIDGAELSAELTFEVSYVKEALDEDNEDQLWYGDFQDCKVYRVYNGARTLVETLDANDVSNNEMELQDEFTPEVGTKQTLSYEAVFTYKEYKRNDNTTLWEDVEATEVTFTKTTDASDEFNIYERPTNPYTQTIPSLATYVNGLVREFSVTLNRSLAYPEGWTVTWSVDNVDAATSDTYTYNPNGATATNKVIRCEVKNVAPDGRTVWYEDDFSNTLRVYQNPASASLTYSLPTADESYTYVGKVTNGFYYSVSVANAGDYGTWKYSWKRNDVEVSNSSQYNYAPNAQGEYTHELAVTCVNPLLDTEVWYTSTKSDIPVLNVFAAPTHTNVDRHLNADNDGNVYALYQGQSIDFATMNTYGGGFTDGWHYSITVDGESLGQGVTTFTPSEAKEYQVEYVLANTVNLPSGGSENWLEVTNTYTVEVFAAPDTVTNFNEYEGANDFHLLVGDEVNLNITGENGDPDSWNIKWTASPVIVSARPSKQGQSFSYAFTGENTGSTNDKTYTVSYKLTNNPKNYYKQGDETDAPYTIEGNKRFVVWKEIVATLENLSLRAEDNHYVLETFAGRNNEKLVLNMTRGAAYWDCQWVAVDGDSTGNAGQFDLPPLAADGKMAKEYKYHVEATYKPDTDIKCSYDVAVVVWPAPQLKNVALKMQAKPATNTSEIQYPFSGTSFDVDCFAGDNFVLDYTIEGGYGLSNRKWTYEIVKVGASAGVVEVGNDNISDAVQNASMTFNADNASQTGQWQVVFKHPYTGEYYSSQDEWFTQTYNIDMTCYPQPEIQPVLTDSASNVRWGQHLVHAYEGNDINLNYKRSNQGNPDGWTYEWRVNGQVKSSNIETWTYVPDVDAAYEDHTITLHITNKVGENYSVDYRDTLQTRVWKRAEFADAFEWEDVNNKENEMGVTGSNVRTGNTMKFTYEPIRYGYTDATLGDDQYKRYEWTGTNMATGSANVKTIVTPSVVSDTYKTNTYTYTLKASNVGPYGKVWDSRSGMSHQVTVHSKPQTPASLTIKGTGKSRTLICQMPAAITDANLADRQYYLVFGYVVGSEHLDFASQLQNNTSQLRWNKQFYTVGQMNNAYVYSLFKSGNVEIASGKRYLTSVDEAWDGSTYNGTTRSVIANETTGVDDVFAVEDAGTCKRVLTLDGKFVANTTEGLVPGVYLVQYENQDGELTTKKIIVK